MDGNDQYPVFFECDSFPREQRRRIENYFNIPRKSGGGECGPLTNVEGNTYRIAFRDPRDQQAVLQRSQHVVELSSGRLEFTVRDSLEPHASCSSTTSTAPAESPQPIPASTPPPSAEEHELHLDGSLLRYMRECPTAEKGLEEKLASVACSVQLYPEEGRVSFRRLAPPAAEDEFKSCWRAEVEELFNSYMRSSCNGRALPRSRSSCQTSGEMRVRSGAGVTGVGERSQVNAGLEDVGYVSCLSENLPSLNLSEGHSAASDEEIQMDAAAEDTATGASAGVPGGSVHLEIIHGTIETQQVDAVVSPMVGLDPLSTRVGNTLHNIAGSQLTARFRNEAGDGLMFGDSVLLEGLPGLLSHAVFFLSLSRWDDDPDGPAVQILRLGLKRILTSCEDRGFGSVALPVLGTGIALDFPEDVVARVLLEEIGAFEQDRVSCTPLLVRIAIHPNYEGMREIFQVIQEHLENEEFTANVRQHDRDHTLTTKRIILLGKTGCGKSSLANTIFGEDLFATDHSPCSGTSKCQSETKSVNGRSITVIDTPGFFDTERSEVDLKPEIMRCITQCAPGPHAVLIVLKVEKFSEQEQAVVSRICQYFSEEALKYAVVVFTHGNQLPKGAKIEEFVSKNKNLSDVVNKCGGRCHVFDNKYWVNSQQNNYRSNQFQREELLKTIDRLVMEQNGGCYTNELLRDVEQEIQKEEEHIKQSPGDLPPKEIRKQAQTVVASRFLIKLAGTATGVLLGVFFGVGALIELGLRVGKNPSEVIKLVKKVPSLMGAPVAAAAAGEAAAVATGVVAAVSAVTVAVAGGVMGGIIGHDAAEGAETPLEAAEMATEAVLKKRNTLKLH